MPLRERWTVVRSHSAIDDRHNLIYFAAGSRVPHLAGVFDGGPPTPAQLAEAIGRARLRYNHERKTP